MIGQNTAKNNNNKNKNWLEGIKGYDKMEEGYGIRPAQGVCCPERTCHNGKKGKKERTGCGYEHKNCKFFKLKGDDKNG